MSEHVKKSMRRRRRSNKGVGGKKLLRGAILLFLATLASAGIGFLMNADQILNDPRAERALVHAKSGLAIPKKIASGEIGVVEAVTKYDIGPDDVARWKEQAAQRQAGK